jgi:transposase
MKTYSLDLREKIVALYDSGGISQRQLAARFCVSVFFVKKLFRQRKTTGSIAPKERRGWQKSRLSEEMRERLIAAYQEKNDYTLSELAARLEQDFGVRLSNPTLCRALQRANLRHKKS